MLRYIIRYQDIIKWDQHGWLIIYAKQNHDRCISEWKLYKMPSFTFLFTFKKIYLLEHRKSVYYILAYSTLR